MAICGEMAKDENIEGSALNDVVVEQLIEGSGYGNLIDGHEEVRQLMRREVQGDQNATKIFSVLIKQFLILLYIEISCVLLVIKLLENGHPDTTVDAVNVEEN